MVFGLLLVTSPFLYQQYMAISLVLVPIVLTLAMVGPLLLAWSAIKSLSRQREISMFFLTAYFMVIITSGLMVLEDYGWIEKLPFNVLFAGALSEILVFSIAITYLIKNMYEERNALAIRIRKHQTELLQSYVTGIERERYRVSRELHDDIGSRLTMLKRMIAQGAKPKYDITSAVDALARDIRLISHQLAPPSLADNNLLGLIESLLADVRQSASINASVENYDFPSMLQEEVKAQLFRVVQEAVQNVVKHAFARNLTIQLFNHAQKLVISIEDDGKGFDTKQTQKGLGFANMRARLHGLGGMLDVSSSASGTVVMLEVPIVIA
jgi:signal transduction histidine kinase